VSEVHVLFVEDEAPFRRFAGAYLAEHGVKVSQAGTGKASLVAFTREKPQVVLLDLNLPDMHGLQVLEEMRNRNPDQRIVVLTCLGDAETAVRALKAGATDYLIKPVELDRLVEVVHQAAKAPAVGAPSALESRKPSTAKLERPTIQDELLWGEDPAWLAVLDGLERVVASDVRAMLVLGERGTGKSALARTFHAVGTRSQGPFVGVHCPSIPEALLEGELFGCEGARGKVERAAGGTLFLDEIGELPLSIQPQLVHLIEHSRYRQSGSSKELEADVQVVCTAGPDLRLRVEQGLLRRELISRLEAFTLELPPLRLRGQDVLRLAARFATRFSAAGGREPLLLTPEARAALKTYAFPDNVRELRNMIQRAVLYTDAGVPIDVQALGLPREFIRAGAAPVLLAPVDLEALLNAVEGVYVGFARQRASSQRESARLLGLDRFALARRRTRTARAGGLAEVQETLSSAPEWVRLILEQRPEALPIDGIDLPDLRAQLERRVIERALEAAGNNRARAATLVGMSRTSLGRRLR
jgi:DNA-binding NtrC family response regulator